MKEQSLISLLHKTRVFRDLTIDDIRLMAKFGELVHFRNRQTILSQGINGPGLFVLLQGEANVTVKILGKGDLKLANIRPGEFFGEVNLLEHTPCTATVISKGKSLCFLLNKTIYGMINIAYPEIHYLVNHAIVDNVFIRQQSMVDEIKSHAKRLIRRSMKLISLVDTRPALRTVRLSDAQKQKEFSYLEATPFFKENFTGRELHVFLRHVKVLDTTNSNFIEKRKNPGLYYYILKGSVKVEIGSSRGKVKFAVFGPNNMICASKIFHINKELFNYQSCGKSTLLELSQDALDLIKQNAPALWYKLDNAGCRYIVSLQKRLNAQLVRMYSETHERKIRLSK